MKFRTEYEAAKASLILSPERPLVLCGSCFTQNIATKMNSCQWKAITPLGTLYNPFSICFALDIMADEKNGKERFINSLFEYDGIWNSQYYDSSFSSRHKDDCVEEFMIRQSEFNKIIEEGKTLIITFGTSVCYHYFESGFIAGNCHKLPENLFYRKRMNASEIFSYCDPVIDDLKKKFPDIRIIFTVSPVRHLKDGFVGNMRSKAELILAIEEILGYNENCFYFPAYEIMNDDLRDYRFYAGDLVHPSEEAIDYIWEKFRNTFLDAAGEEMIKEGERKMKAAKHRPKLGALQKPLH